MSRLIEQAVFIDEVDVSSDDYTAQKDGNGHSAPFLLLVETAGLLDVLPLDNTDSVLIPVIAGYNPIQCIGVNNNASNTATGIFALYGNKPATV